MRQASQAVQDEHAEAEVVGRDEHIAPAPRVSVQAFCETVETAAAIQAAGEDRRMAKAHLRIQMGGLIAAIEAYQNSPTPNVIILESENRSEDMLGGLYQVDQWFSGEGGRGGDTFFLLAPAAHCEVVPWVRFLSWSPQTKPVGRIIAVVGA